MDRVKVNDAMACPLRLDLGTIDPGEAGAGGVGGAAPLAEYVLSGIMIHKGSAARAGHYVALVDRGGLSAEPPAPGRAGPEGSTHDWWRFDDGDVRRLADGPAAAAADHGSAAAVKAAAAKLSAVSADLFPWGFFSCFERSCRKGKGA